MGRLKFKGNSISGFGVELWNQLKGKPFETLKSADFNVSGGELQIKDKVTPAQLNAKANQTDVTLLSETIATNAELGYLGGNLINIPNRSIDTKDYIDLMPLDIPSGTYTFSYDIETANAISWAFKDSDEKNIATGSMVGHGISTFTVTTPIKYLTFYASGIATLKNVMLNKGDIEFPYAPYSKSNVALTREAQDLEASNFLGWSTPTELIEQGLYNYVVGDVCHQRVGRVGIADLGWTHYGISDSGGHLFRSDNISNIVSATDKAPNVFINKYVATTSSTRTDKSVSVGVVSRLDICDSAYSSVDAFKTAMSGVYIYYELATEQTVTTQLFDEIATLKPTAYQTNGLSYTRCTYGDGGYFRVGKMAIVNLNITGSENGDIYIDGLPKPMSSNMRVGVIAENRNTEQSCYSQINGNGQLYLKGGIASNNYIISATYLAN